MAALQTLTAFGKVNQHRWTLAPGDLTGDAANNPGAADRTVQVTGDFGAGTVTIQGSNQHPPVFWSTMHDTSGADLLFSVAGIEVILENPLYIRPILSGGTGTGVQIDLISRGY